MPELRFGTYEKEDIDFFHCFISIFRKCGERLSILPLSFRMPSCGRMVTAARCRAFGISLQIPYPSCDEIIDDISRRRLPRVHTPGGFLAAAAWIRVVAAARLFV